MTDPADDLLAALDRAITYRRDVRDLVDLAHRALDRLDSGSEIRALSRTLTFSEDAE